LLYISDNTLLIALYVAKFHGVTPPNSKIIDANTLDYKPIFDPPFGKNCWLAPSPLRCTLARLSHSLARVKISGRSAP